METERRKTIHLLSTEWQRWLDDVFNPHMKHEENSHQKLDRLSLAVFGDGNGTTGIKKDVETLVCTSKRIEHFFDGVALLWKVLVAVLAALAIGAGFLKTIGWI